MWKILCTVYPDQFRQVSQYCRSGVRCPSFPLTGYVNLVQSLDCSWVTSLNVWTEFARVPELVNLADVTNLVSLEVNTPTTPLETPGHENQEVTTLNDRILRTWSELAETSGAFQHLRVLRLYGQRDLTGDSFLYLSKLPSLEYCVLALSPRIMRSSALSSASSQGWFTEDGSDHPMLKLSVCDSSKAFDDQQERQVNHLDDQIPLSSLKKTPLLQFSVGNRRENMRGCEVIVLRRKLDSHRNLAKRQKRGLIETALPQVDRASQKKARKPAMKQRAKDLSRMLAEFGR